MEPEELVTIHRFSGSEEAHLWKGRLRAEGIKSVVIHDFYSGGAAPTFELQVRRIDYKRANKIIGPLIIVRPFKAIKKLEWFWLIFGLVVLVPGILLISFPQDSGSIWPGLLFIVIGSVPFVYFLLVIIMRR